MLCHIKVVPTTTAYLHNKIGCGSELVTAKTASVDEVQGENITQEDCDGCHCARALIPNGGHVAYPDPQYCVPLRSRRLNTLGSPESTEHQQ